MRLRLQSGQIILVMFSGIVRRLQQSQIPLPSSKPTSYGTRKFSNIQHAQFFKHEQIIFTIHHHYAITVVSIKCD